MLNYLKLKVSKLLINILISIEGEKEMMAMLFACRVVEGRTEWEKVPAKLKPQVAEILVNDFALPELVPEDYRNELGL